MIDKASQESKVTMRPIFPKENLLVKLIRRNNNHLANLIRYLLRMKKKVLKMLNLNRDKLKKIGRLKRKKMSN